MLNKRVEKTLNDQIAKEAYASNSYLAMASWCEQKGLRGCTAFFYGQSDEERQHMLKLIKYVNDSAGEAVIDAITQPKSDYKSIKDIFETSLKQERAVTASINNLVELAFTTKDHATYNFLQWYVSEQHEEESLFKTILDIINLGEEDKQSLLLVDIEIGKIRAAEAQEKKG